MSTNHGDSRVFHESEIPSHLMQYFDELLDKPVQPCTVLDIFSGSSRTGIAAVKLGRDYIGIDLKPDYHAMAKDALIEAGADVQVLQ